MSALAAVSPGIIDHYEVNVFPLGHEVILEVLVSLKIIKGSIKFTVRLASYQFRCRFHVSVAVAENACEGDPRGRAASMSSLVRM